jgi:hypothetical protein
MRTLTPPCRKHGKTKNMKTAFSLEQPISSLTAQATRGFESLFNLLCFINIYSISNFQREGGELTYQAIDPLAPACDDEAEALKNAPPWLGSWGHKPTVRQRIMLWVDYILRGDEH